jgi:predicted transcriptional regulator
VKLVEVQKILRAEILCGGENLERDAEIACGADLMSDVLAFTKERALLLTGLTNIQVVRTAEVSDLVGIVFVRGKRPTAEVIGLAEAKGIPLLLSNYPMYESCGLLYKNGLRGCSEKVMACEA